MTTKSLQIAEPEKYFAIDYKKADDLDTVCVKCAYYLHINPNMYIGDDDHYCKENAQSDKLEDFDPLDADSVTTHTCNFFKPLK